MERNNIKYLARSGIHANNAKKDPIEIRKSKMLTSVNMLKNKFFKAEETSSLLRSLLTHLFIQLGQT